TAKLINTPIRRIRSACCARAASGQVAAEPTITLMKSRRRIAFPKAWDHANPSMITAGIYDRRNGVRPPFCVAATLRTNVRFGSKADIGRLPIDVRFTPESRHWNRHVYHLQRDNSDSLAIFAAIRRA